MYAAYGGVFVALSLLWGWRVDKIAPDRFDILGGLVALFCPFLKFSITVEPGDGPVWLEMTGPQGTKEFLVEVFI